jgi:hypothetical protein
MADTSSGLSHSTHQKSSIAAGDTVYWRHIYEYLYLNVAYPLPLRTPLSKYSYFNFLAYSEPFSAGLTTPANDLEAYMLWQIWFSNLQVPSKLDGMRAILGRILQCDPPQTIASPGQKLSTDPPPFFRTHVPRTLDAPRTHGSSAPSAGALVGSTSSAPGVA